MTLALRLFHCLYHCVCLCVRVCLCLSNESDLEELVDPSSGREQMADATSRRRAWKLIDKQIMGGA